MTNCLLKDISEKILKYRNDLSDKEKSLYRTTLDNKITNKTIDSYWYSNNTQEAISREYINLIKDIIFDEKKCLDFIENKYNFMCDYVSRNTFYALKWIETYQYNNEFRKLIVSTIPSEKAFILSLEKPEDLDFLYQSIGHNNNEANKESVLERLWLSIDNINVPDIYNIFNKNIIQKLSFKEILDVMVDSFNANKTIISKLENKKFYRSLGENLFCHILEYNRDHNMDKVISEYESLSDSDKEFVNKMILSYRNLYIGSVIKNEGINNIRSFKRFKSIDILEAYTFSLNSNNFGGMILLFYLKYMLYGIFVKNKMYLSIFLIK